VEDIEWFDLPRRPQSGALWPRTIREHPARRGKHEAWFSEYLAEGPSSHFPRGAPGASPYVRGFMSADFS